MRTSFKDTFTKVCNLTELANEELRIVGEIQCNTIEDFDKEYKQAREAMHRAFDPKDTERFKNYAEEIDRIATEATAVNVHAGPSVLTLAEDMEVEEQNVLELIDPVSKKQILNPVKNKICKHVYEEGPIKASILASKRVRCPYLGCGNKHHLQLDHLEVDDELKRKIDTARTQQVEQEENRQENYEDSD